MEHIIIPENSFNDLQNKINALYEMLVINSNHDSKANNEWLDGAETMKILKVSSRTLQNYRDNGKIGFTLLGARKIQYSRSSVEKLLMKNYNPPRKE